ncbi:MAG: hypothetical protein BWZ10_02294 [candidate division BRC1 bacterium ADurb.BinA364]|nr:MAG: hypothetical protein BWZ10_02294 [candidate division BRC1 bacterium ADurb.BinA364]
MTPALIWVAPLMLADMPSLLQMSRRMVSHRGAARLLVHLGRKRVANLDLAALDLASMQDDGVGRLFRIGHDEGGGFVFQPPPVADLAAGFGVERRKVEHDCRFVAGADFFRLLAIAEQSQHAPFGGHGFIAQETRFALGLENAIEQFGFGSQFGAFPGSLGAGFVLGHGVFVALAIDCDAAFISFR